MSAADADRRTHPATQKRIEEFRQRGEVAISRDANMVASMLGGVATGIAYSHSSYETIRGLGRSIFGGLDTLSPADTLVTAALGFSTAALPVAVGALAGHVISTAWQLGYPPALVAPAFSPGRILSIESFAQLVNPKAATGRLLKALAKVGFVGFAAWMALVEEFEIFMTAPATEAFSAIERVGQATIRLGTYSGVALALLGVLDFVLAKRRVGAKMRMTTEEVRREYRDSEGDPIVRRRRRQRMKELAKRKLAVTVPKADVVIVNPTEYAVAIRYRTTEDRAPRVLAKGRRGIAERIRELARQGGVPIVAQPPLARLLYKVVPEGGEVPPNVYRAVAEVLAYVYRLKARRSR